MAKMNDLIDLSLKSAMKSQDLQRLETNAAQFIKSSFKIIDNMRQANGQASSKLHLIHRECITLSLDEKLAKLISSFKKHEERKVKEIVRKKSHLKQRTIAKSTQPNPMNMQFLEQEEEQRNYPTQNAPLQQAPAQLEMLKREKIQMQLLYNKELEELLAIEGTLREISHLQGLIEEQIANQSEKIESIYDASWEIHATVKRGNEQLAKAKGNSSSFRIFLVMFLLLSAMSLLFLNWYSP
jgi:hypothetical protein